MKKYLYTIFISSFVSSLLFLPACTIFDSDNFNLTTRTTYELAPVNIESLANKTNMRILIRLPLALTAIDSNRLVLRQPHGKTTWLANIQWSDPIPQMIQTKLIELFENSQAFKAVLRPGDGISSSHHLLSDIRKFEINNNTVQLELSLKLFSRKQGEIIASNIFKANVPVGLTTDSRIAAFNQAFSIIGNQIVFWVIENKN